MTHGYVAIVTAQKDLIALGDDSAVPIQTGIDGGLGAAGADGLDLGNGVCYLKESTASLEEAAEKVGRKPKQSTGIL